MTLFQQTGFNPTNIRTIILVLAMAHATFALQIEAPPEIAEAVSIYSKEANAESKNAILKVSVVKNTNCSAFAFKLMSADNGKVIKEVERCFTETPNTALQNGVFEVFGLPVESETSVSGGMKTTLIGIGFVTVGLLLYYSKQPKPVYIYKHEVSEVTK
ncbi:MAG: hypothetical protein LBH25_05695 [Fibromonadaceae bacterium]|jgi:hypothetical protein|nr:hypothetical protein [Fibromonadaceae bacterium]